MSATAYGSADGRVPAGEPRLTFFEVLVAMADPVRLADCSPTVEVIA